jgi:hypothetical protein
VAEENVQCSQKAQSAINNVGIVIPVGTNDSVHETMTVRYVVQLSHDCLSSFLYFDCELPVDEIETILIWRLKTHG